MDFCGFKASSGVQSEFQDTHGYIDNPCLKNSNNKNSFLSQESKDIVLFRNCRQNEDRLMGGMNGHFVKFLASFFLFSQGSH